jgi:L-rhamnose mutarotase
MLELLNRDVIMHLFDHLSAYEVVTLSDINKRMHTMFTEEQKQTMRNNCDHYKKRKKQTDYIDNLMDTMISKGEYANEKREKRGKYKKKKNYIFCEGCGNIIRKGIHRYENHLRNCPRVFTNCKSCCLPFSVRKQNHSRYRNTTYIANECGTQFPAKLVHDMSKCRYKVVIDERFLNVNFIDFTRIKK